MRIGRLRVVEKALQESRRRSRGRNINFSVPSLWVGRRAGRGRVKVDPFDFYLTAVRRGIAATPGPLRTERSGGEWTRRSVVYNCLIRTTTAFDHDGNGKLDLPLNEDGFRETGTFLKTIVLLPYLKRLGINTIHLLPITAIGRDGNKGTLGSPYAIRNPYAIDEMLCEPILGLDPATEFGAFSEAAHTMGFRIVVEFVFRTAAKDSDWVREHPEWFYWIREEIASRHDPSLRKGTYGSPLFAREELNRIHEEVAHHRFHNLLPPHKEYRDMFTPAPQPDKVELANGRYIGRLGDGQRVKIPGAFADWPPDDPQPPWDDVTYLRMYTHPEFNYIAYNTIRMYDSRLSAPEHRNEELWERIIGIVPFYQREFGINGVMIDMGHALPIALKKRIIAEGRRHDPDFAFWDEDFSITSGSKDEGYNAVVGSVWLDEPHPERMMNFLIRCSTEGFPVAFLATSETHNTPRAASRPGGKHFAQWSAVVNAFLPGVMFVHSGFELGETYPINTGLDFSHDELNVLPSHKLPLFSDYQFDWTRRGDMIDFLKIVLRIRKKFSDLVTNSSPAGIEILPDRNRAVLSFARISAETGIRIGVVTNSNFFQNEKTSIELKTRKRTVVDLLSGRRFPLMGKLLQVSLKPGECIVFEY